MAEIRVTGTGTTTSPPDQAAFTFSCEGRGAEASDALAQATAGAELVIGLLDSVDVPKDRRGVDRAAVHPRIQWRNDREVRDGWDAHASVQCTIDDPVAAFDLLEKAATLDRVSVHGPHWQIRPDNPAHDVVRKLAVDDARSKAESYASAAGLSLGALTELIEGGAMPGGRRRMQAMASEQAAPLEASEQSVRASVTLVFEAH